MWYSNGYIDAGKVNCGHKYHLTDNACLNVKFQFGLRRVFLLVTGISIAVAVLTSLERRHSRETATANDLMRNGFVVNWELVGWRILPHRYRKHVVEVRFDWATAVDSASNGSSEDPFASRPSIPPDRVNTLLCNALRDCGDLRRVSLQRVELSDDSVANLEKSRLSFLYLGWCSAPEGGLSFPPTLSGLGISQAVQLEKDVIRRLGYLLRLESIDLSYTPINDEDLRFIVPLNGLRELTLCDTRVTGAGLKSLAVMPCLNSLDLSGSTAQRDVTLDFLADLTQLRHLKLRSRRIDRADALCIKSHGALESLDLSECEIDGRAIEELVDLKCITALSIDNMSEHQSSLIACIELPSLEKLSIAGVRVPLSDLRTLLHNQPYLSRLYLTHVDGEVAEILDALKASRLEYVAFDERTYSNQDVAILERCTRPVIKVSEIRNDSDDSPWRTNGP